MKILTASLFIIALFSSFYQTQALTGTWEYAGDITNGTKEGAPTEYTLQRVYTISNFQAYVIEKGYEPEKYETGNYTLNADSCIETQTWCSQPSKLLNINIHYQYTVRNDSLTLKGTLPNGTIVEEYWKKVK